MSSRPNIGLPEIFSPSEVAKALDCSEWWVKEQARRRRIPFMRSGSGYRFTRDHVDEIFRILEERPDAANTSESSDVSTRRRAQSGSDAPAVQLRARRPRRARSAA
ncbi:excisionase [Streptomyces agglomeratus]|uniref:helix-turn-helix domain-containing protein n=1 Tax=Streptomyces agglomeratus TaxID=285458 RepID=UPI0008545BE1|nr:helix-turn-helix domain-containing protein [Streptomyces agglomeratus]OEJ40142.1 excisionase [Streptomyces agglomeratus]OEJ45478.1 excisionase [Streptomyces agglomeratus]